MQILWVARRLALAAREDERAPLGDLKHFYCS